MLISSLCTPISPTQCRSGGIFLVLEQGHTGQAARQINAFGVHVLVDVQGEVLAWPSCCRFHVGLGYMVCVFSRLDHLLININTWIQKMRICSCPLRKFSPDPRSLYAVFGCKWKTSFHLWLSCNLIAMWPVTADPCLKPWCPRSCVSNYDAWIMCA